MEFDKKDVFGTTLQLNIESHLENVLAHQLYFLELIINEIKNYKYIDDQKVPEKQSVFQRMFTAVPKTEDN